MTQWIKDGIIGAVVALGSVLAIGGGAPEIIVVLVPAFVGGAILGWLLDWVIRAVRSGQ